MISKACKNHSFIKNVHFAYLDEYTEKWVPKEDQRKFSKRKKAVVCIETQQEFSSVREAAQKMNIVASLITRCCKGDIEATHGYHFQYKRKEEDYNAA